MGDEDELTATEVFSGDLSAPLSLHAEIKRALLLQQHTPSRYGYISPLQRACQASALLLTARPPEMACATDSKTSLTPAAVLALLSTNSMPCLRAAAAQQGM